MFTGVERGVRGEGIVDRRRPGVDDAGARREVVPHRVLEERLVIALEGAQPEVIRAI